MTSTSPPVLPPRRDEGSARVREATVRPDLPAAAGEPGPGRRRRRPEDSRRLSSAGHALAVCVLGLLFAFVLNAAGAHKRAYSQPDGWKRDVALAVTGPLSSVSGALRLDRPRAAVLAALGRSGEDDIDAGLGIDVAAPSSTPTVKQKPKPKPAAGGTAVNKPAVGATPAAKSLFTPQHPLRLWIAGDSLVITPGYAILRAIDRNRAVKSVDGVDGRVATGLTRPDVFNWFQEVRDEVREKQLGAVVLSFGGNDDKAYMTGLPDGVTIGDFGDAAWRKEYGRRVGALFDLVRREGAHTVWIGLPQTNDPDQTRRFDVVNSVVSAEARKRPDAVTFIDTFLLLAAPNGGYSQYVDLPGQGTVKARADDGVHFERAGGDLIATELLRALGQKLDISSWRSAAKQP